MASDYLSKQILHLETEFNNPKIKKRIGELKNKPNLYNKDNFNMQYPPMETVKTLLFDDGSTRYNAWLMRYDINTILNDDNNT